MPCKPSPWPNTKRNVFHLVAVFYLATEFLDFPGQAPTFQKHFIGIGDGEGLFNQAMLNQNAMIRRYCKRRWTGRCMCRRSALVLFLGVSFCTMLTGFLNAVISLTLMRFLMLRAK